MTGFRYLTLDEVEHLHALVLARSGGADGLRDRGALESAVAQPRQSFGGEDLYPTLAAKAAALAHGLVANHPFMDGNKRIGHAAMEVFLVLNGHEVEAPVDEQEALFLDLAAGKVSRAELTEWLSGHLQVL